MPPVGRETQRYVSGEIRQALDAEGWRWKALDVAVKIAMPIMLGISAWSATTLLELDKRVQILEATRYTKDDAAREREGLKEALNDIKILLARQGASVEEVRKGLQKLEVKVERLGPR